MKQQHPFFDTPSGDTMASMALTSVIRSVLPSVVALGWRVEVTTSETPPNFPFIVGTGFAVHEGGLIATNRHVAEQLERLPLKDRFVAFFHRAELSGGQLFAGVRFCGVVRAFAVASFTPAGRYAGDPNPDLAFLEIDVRGLPAVRIRSEANSLETGVEVVSVGFPMGRERLSPHGGDIPSQLNPFVRRGIISSVFPCECENPHGFSVDIESEGGASGSPICSTEDGAVLGILYGGYPGSPVTYGVPGHILATGLESIREKWVPNPSRPLLLELLHADVEEAEQTGTEQPMEWNHLGRFARWSRRT
jgi:S1-C subfamily serine protease